MALRSGSYTLGIVLILVGGLMLMGQFGINLGWVIALVIAFYLVYKGWNMYKHAESSGKRGIGIVLIAIGLLWMTGLLHVVVGLVIASAVIYLGWKMWKDTKQMVVVTDALYDGANRQDTFDETNEMRERRGDHLDQWEQEVINDFRKGGSRR